ncbi:MAG: tetratricopeptide repeat protein [Deltaproteobacteria bacterium]|nr:tetratricopeptide repeat protein [Deltaproteobacteria bacterium]
MTAADAIRAASRAPTDVHAQLAAAYASDRDGDEPTALRYYERARALGVPAADLRGFTVGYGSTLRNLGRADDAVAILGEAVAADPDYAPYRAFLALALLDAGQPRAAVATMLGVALDTARPGAFDRFDRALGAYYTALLEAAVGAR